MDPVETIQKIALAADEQHKIELLEQLQSQLSFLRSGHKEKFLIPLLYDKHWFVRQEAAFMIDQMGVKLKDEYYYRYLLALQDFENLFLHFNNPIVRAMIFETLKDYNHRLRAKIFRHLKFEDCQTPQEQGLFWYGSADYAQLIPLSESSPQIKAFVVQLLKFGIQKENNPPYHRRRCAETLQHIEYTESVDQLICDLLHDAHRSKAKPKAPVRDLRPLPIDEPVNSLTFRIKVVISRLQEKGLYIDGQPVFPQIQIGSITNRITYRNPGVQTWPKEQRLQRMFPVGNKALLTFDFVSIEPTLLLHFLVQNFFLSLEDIPEQDIYLAFYPADRRKGKQLLNKLINGGRLTHDELLTPFAQKIATGIRQLKPDLMSRARKSGHVETISGNTIPIDPQVSNFGGKVINRLIQGSASDIFNETIASVLEQIEANRWPVQLYFVLFDEFWLTCPAKELQVWEKRAVKTIEHIIQTFRLLVPLKIKSQSYEPQTGHL